MRVVGCFVVNLLHTYMDLLTIVGFWFLMGAWGECRDRFPGHCDYC